MTQIPPDNTRDTDRRKPRGQCAPTRQRGFTIVELLIVIAVIILLLSILIVGVNRAVRGAQAANTRSLMGSMKQALVAFKEDHGYLPPVLNGDRGAHFAFTTGNSYSGPDPTNGSYADEVQAWYSVTSMAEYLVGWDDGYADGYGDISNDPSDGSDYDGEIPHTGIRSPGGDGVWGATLFNAQDGSLNSRQPHSPGTLEQDNPSLGRRFGPYLELKDERLLASTDGVKNPATGMYNVFFPGDPGYNEDDPRVIVDYWGSPIQYYRPAYPPGSLNSAYPKIEATNDEGDTVPVPTLSDVFVLRPYETDVGNVINGLNDDSTFSGSGDPTSVRQLLSAEFALLSPGPDRSLVPTQRIDEDEFNRDNIVELGP